MKIIRFFVTAKNVLSNSIVCPDWSSFSVSLQLDQTVLALTSAHTLQRYFHESKSLVTTLKKGCSLVYCLTLSPVEDFGRPRARLGIMIIKIDS